MNKIKSGIPNTITCLNLLSGCVAIALAFRSGESFGSLTGYQLAFIFIGAAAIFDFCDGAAARALKAYSNVGKELDSLADLVSFGVAPAAMLYNVLPADYAWTAITIPVCGALRLAKFNVDTRQTTSFIGLPIPANAIFWIGAVAWIQAYGPLSDWLMPVLIFIESQLMLDEIPLFSLKFHDFRLSTENLMRYIIIIAAVVLTAIFGLPGLALTIMLYLIMGLIYPFLP